MKNFFLILCGSLLLASCTNDMTTVLPEKAQKVDNQAFGLKNDFIIAIAGADQNMPFTQIVAKSGSGFLLYKKDSTGVIVCDNIQENSLCQKTKTTHLDQKDTDIVLRVSEKSLWRVLGNETTLTNTEVVKNTATPKFTLSDPSKLPKAFTSYFPEKSEERVDYCMTSKRNEEQEILCIWKSLTPLYQYMDTSGLPLTSTRAIFAYKELTLTQTELLKLASTLKSEVLP